MGPLVSMKGITVVFPGVVANQGIDLDVARGEVRALLGENGAGKTTLMNVLYGLVTPDAGEIRIDGSRADITSPSVAIQRGIGMVHQQFMLIPPLTVAENIVLGCEPARARVVFDRSRAVQAVRKLSEEYGLRVDPSVRVENISVGMQQRVEILKALYRGAQVLVLDEPTAILTPQEVEELSVIIRNLAAQGKSVIFITHKLKEVMRVADAVTVIRRGKVVGTVRTADTTLEELARMMVGRDVVLSVPKGPCNPGKVVLEVHNVHALNARRLPALRGVSLTVREGEILGVAGIEGNGQSELVEVITGLRSVVSGTVVIDGKALQNRSPRKLIENGAAHIPEDRVKRGLVVPFSVAENSVLETYYRPPFAGGVLGLVLDEGGIRRHAEKLVEEFDIRTPSTSTRTGSLSGGNQQKVIVGRELSRGPRLLVAAQPTRGLDVGATEFVHTRLVAERDRGRAVLLVSLELDEILSLSDRIIVLYEGRIAGELIADEATEELLGMLMAGAVPAGGRRTQEA